MRHHRTRLRLKRGFSHRKQMLENTVLNLLKHQEIKTTLVKAKAVQRLADRVITLGKANSLNARRQVFSILGQRDITQKLFNEIAPRYKSRQGGYTRVLRIGERKGDNAPMAILELTEKVVIARKPRKDKKALGKAAHEHADHTHAEKGHHGHDKPVTHERHDEKLGPKKSEGKMNFFKNLKQFFRKKGGSA